jgi:hypothetical protein
MPITSQSRRSPRMRSFFTLPVLAAVVAAAPRPQDINFDQVEQAADPVIITPAVNVAAQVATVAAVTEQAAAASAAVSAEPAINSALPVAERSLVERASTCTKQKAGKGPVASPDTPEAFLALDELSVSLDHSLYIRLDNTDSRVDSELNGGYTLRLFSSLLQPESFSQC